MSYIKRALWNFHCGLCIIVYLYKRLEIFNQSMLIRVNQSMFNKTASSAIKSNQSI